MGPRGSPQTPRGDPSAWGPSWTSPRRLPPSPTPLLWPRAVPQLRGSGAAATPRNSLSAPPARRAPQRLRGAQAAGSRQPRGLTLFPRLALHPLARSRSSFISTHRPPPFSSQLRFKSETRCSASSRHSRHCHRLSRRGRRRRCGRAEEAAAGAAARGPPGYVVPRPRPALPVPGGLARPGPRAPLHGRASVARGRGRVDLGPAFPR